MLPITAIYAGLIALLFLLLSGHVIVARFRAGVSVGDGGDKSLFKAIRVHSNMAEYAPISLILLAITEAQGAPTAAVHLLGALLLFGRVAHGIGLGSTPQILILRRAGMAATFAMLALAGFGLVAHGLI